MLRKYQLSDSNGSSVTGNEFSGGSGCFVSTITGFVLVLIASLLAVGVGLVVHLASPGELICHCQIDNVGGVTDNQGGQITTTAAVTTTSSVVDNATILQQCLIWASSGHPEICSACLNASITTSPSATSLPTTAVPEIINYRLPSNTKPYHYNVYLQPNMYTSNAENFDFEGSVQIWIQCLATSNRITLHATRLDINSASIIVHHIENSTNLFKSHSNDSLRQFLILELSENMTSGENYSVSMKFTGPLQGDGTGLYLSSYLDGTETIYLATTQFEAPHARKAFPCYDEPALKATFNTTLRHKLNTGRNYTTLSNMDIYTSYEDGEFGVDVYSTSVVMPTYLLAFIVCDYEYTENLTDNNVQYRTYARPSAINYTEKAQYHGLKIFNRYEEYFNPNYSLPKLDNIAIPDFNAGAMENWGLITYRENLLYIPGESTASAEKWIAEIISHEIAHQWFGNLVSPKWWKWLWLNEAFASFWQYHIVGELYPNWKSLELYIVDDIHAVMVTDALRSSHPMTWDVESNAELSSIFDGITYKKGAGIVRMMHFIMGQVNFINGLNNYLDSYKYSVAEHKNLWDKLTETMVDNGETWNMTEIMDPWVTQENYPVVLVNKTETGYTLSQQRFLIGSTDEEASGDTSVYGYKWPIPISYTTKITSNFDPDRMHIHMMPLNGSEVDINEDVTDKNNWILVNLQQHGFYRVNYEEDNWNALIKQLKEDHEVIHPINRAQIINDAANNAKAGLLRTSIALKTLEYLANETNYLPWKAFSREMEYVDSMLERTLLYGKFSRKIKTMVEGPLTNVGQNITDSMEHIDIFGITTLASLACKHGVDTCINTAKYEFKNWMTSLSNNIDPNLRILYYCTAVKEGSYEEWDFVYREYNNTQSVSQKDALRFALACSKMPSLLQRVLDMSLDPAEVRPQDIRTTITAVSANPLGLDLAWNFVKYNFAELDASLTGIGTFQRLIGAITEKFNTQFYLDQLNEMIANGQTGSIEGSFIRAVENTRSNIKWLSDNYDIYNDWLNL